MGHPVPAAIYNKPRLHHGLLFYVQAFDELCTCRGNGVISSPPTAIITWEQIDTYARRYNIVGRQYEFFKALMFRLDDAYLRMLHEIHSTKADKK